MLDNIRIVMVHPSHSGNIGAAARAMKNMGLSQLCLVAPKSFPDQVALTRASGADDILAAAKVVADVKSALHGVQWVFGASARVRHLPVPLVDARECAQRALDCNAQVAILFGRENSGLTNDELALCHYHVHIPTQPSFSSLNLSQAIQVIAYELRMVYLHNEPADNPIEKSLATFEECEGFFSQLETTLTEIEFLNPKQPKMLMSRLRRLFNRASLETTEIHILRGILSKVQRWASMAKQSSKQGEQSD